LRNLLARRRFSQQIQHQPPPARLETAAQGR